MMPRLTVAVTKLRGPHRFTRLFRFRPDQLPMLHQALGRAVESDADPLDGFDAAMLWSDAVAQAKGFTFTWEDFPRPAC